MVQVARRVLQENGFAADFPPGLDATIPAHDRLEDARDLRSLAWSSIDNVDSQDLDQIEVAFRLPDNTIRVLVGIADVDALVAKGSPIDQRAATNTCSLYTGVHMFPMLPEALALHRTSLLQDVEHLAVVTEFVVREDGSLDDAQARIYVARVLNRAKMAYEHVGPWLEGEQGRELTNADGSAIGDPRIPDQLRLQDEAAQRLRKLRHEHGALELETIEANAVAKDGKVVDIQLVQESRSRELIADLMIAANGVTARYLEAHRRSSIRRVVRKPKRWDRIVELARGFGTALPAEPNAAALSAFLVARRAAAPLTFGDLSLSVIKLVGPGEYALQRANDPDIGHFGLAVEDYAHSTAPNRRFPDLVTQRLLKTCALDAPPAYTDDELGAIAAHCTDRENSARKVERTMRKVAAAAFLAPRIGEVFDSIVTGAGDHGVFVRLLHPPAEGRVVSGENGLDVGDRVKVRLVDTSVERGFIDFAAIR
jgi:exoribonuclease-2